MVLADTLEKALPYIFKEKGPIEEGSIEEVAIKEVPIEYESLPEGKLPTTKVYPVEEHNKDLLLAKASEEEPKEGIGKAPEEECIED